MKEYCFVFLLFFSLLSCTSQSTLERALKCAGKNRSELEKVLQLYEGDELKYQAATFLIENMVYHHYRDGEWVDTYEKYFEYLGRGEYTPEEVFQKVEYTDGGLSKKKWVVKKDIEEVDSSYLTENIEWAFKVWQEQPWGKNISFEEFCEHILPYRIGDERPALWRKELYEKYNPMLDQFREGPDAMDPVRAAQVMISLLSGMHLHWYMRFPAGPHVGPLITQWKSGSCREYSDVLIYILRAVGIPCGMDYFPMHGTHNEGHYWTYIPGPEGNSYFCDFPNPHLRLSSDIYSYTSKVFRKRFAFNHIASEQMSKQKENIWPLFRYPLIEDVTSLYKKRLYSISLPFSILKKELGSDEHVYLCGSRYLDWEPIGWNKPEKEYLYFEDVAGGSVFTLGVYRKNRLQIISDPFYLDAGNGIIRFIEPREREEEITVYIKYMQSEIFFSRMRGGVFEGSNTPDFEMKDTLFRIEEIPYRMYHAVYPESEKEYRYVRYYGADGTHCNVSEISFYTDPSGRIPLQGEVIGTPGCYQRDGSHEYTHAFDGNPYTSFDYMEGSGGWTGLDLGKPTRIGKIIYTPRNHDNFVRPGDKYELFCFKNGEWLSQGQQFATSDSLNYRVPAGVLYYLKNHTRGNDERVFEYRRGRQIFM